MLQPFHFIHNKKDENLADKRFIPDCGSSSGRKQAVALHSITDIKFELFLEYYFGGREPVANTHQFQDIINLLNTPLPSKALPDYIEFVWDTATDIITHSCHEGTPDLCDGNSDYSACLFKGIHELDNPVTIEFYIAKNQDEEHTAIFKTIQADGTTHYYDVSNDIP